MKDVTFGVKVPEAQREEINKLMKDSGLVGREFMQQLVNSYMLSQHKQEIPEMAEDIKELEELTSRINQIYIYLGTRFQNTVKDYKKEVDKTSKENDLSIEAYNMQIKEYKKSVEDIKLNVEELKKTNNKLKEDKVNTEEELSQLKEYNENYKELNSEYKSKIEDLTTEIKDLRDLKVKNKDLTKANDDLASDLWFSKREVEKLNNHLLEAKEEFEKSKKRIRDQYKLESQTSLLELKLKHQETTEKLNNQMYKMQESHNDKIKDLIIELEQSQNIKQDKDIKK